MLKKPYSKNIELFRTKIREEYPKSITRLIKLDTETLEFELQRNRDAYLLGLDRFNSLKDNARVQLGVIGLIGTVVMTILFSIAGVKQFFGTSDMNLFLLLWGFIFICEVSWLLQTPYWTHTACSNFSLVLQKIPENIISVSDEVYDKRKVMIGDIYDYKSKLDLSDSIFQTDFHKLDKNESLIYSFITGTVSSIFFFLASGLLPMVSTSNTSTSFQIILVIDIILIFSCQLLPVLSVVYDLIKRKIGNIKNSQSVDT